MTLEPLDAERRDQGALMVYARDFIPEDHLLLRLESAVDLGPLAAPFEAYYCPDNGRPALHPEILVRALLLGRLYRIFSFRELCRRLQTDIAFRYFCHLGLGDPVFDHSTITRFMDRVGKDAFEGLCRDLTELLRRQGLLSDDAYLDSTLLAANASSSDLAPTAASAEEFAAAVVRENGLFLGPSGPGPDAPVAVYQDHRGRLPLSSSDPDARWAKGSRGPARLSYKLSVATDDHGFIVGHRVDLATVADHEGGARLLRDLAPPGSLAADKGYSAGAFRAALRQRGITTYIPLPAGHPPAFLSVEGFRFGPFTLICPEGQQLRARHRPKVRKVRYRALREQCGGCARQASCRAAGRHGFDLGADTVELVRAEGVNTSASYRRGQRRRRSVAEGVNSHLKGPLGLGRVKLRGLKRVPIEAALAVLALNLKKLADTQGRGPAVSTAAADLRPCRRSLRNPAHQGRPCSTGLSTAPSGAVDKPCSPVCSP